MPRSRSLDWMTPWPWYPEPFRSHVIQDDFLEDMNFFSNTIGYTKLISAVIQSRSAEHIDSLIRDGENVNYINNYDDDKTVLHYAVSHSSLDLDVILTLLNRGADIHARSFRDGRTPLHFAVQNPHMKPEIIRALLARQGANVDVLSDSRGNKFTPLHYALGGEYCKEEIVIVLLNQTANLNEVGGGLLPIHVALLNPYCSMDIIRLLIQTGSPVSTPSSVGPPLFILLCRQDCDSEVLKLMLRNKADPNCNDYLTLVATTRVSLKVLRCSDVVYTKIETFNPHVYDDSFYRYARPLVAGLINPNISVDDYELLLKYGGNPNLMASRTRYSLLSVAIESKNLDVQKLRVLLKYGVKFCENDKNPAYSLFSIMHISKKVSLTLGILQAVMDYKDNFNNLYNSKGCNLLHYGLKTDISPEYLMLLIKYFPPDEIGPCKSSALHHAVSSSCPLHIIEFLLEQSTCVDVRDEKLNTPLHLAGGRPEVVKTLLRYGADVTLVNSENKTPFVVYLENHGGIWSFQMLQNLIKAMVLCEYMERGFFHGKSFVKNLFGQFSIENLDCLKTLKKDLIPFIQDCQSELGYAFILDPSVFYFFVSRFSLKLHLKKGLIKIKTPNRDESILSIKDKMFQTLRGQKVLWMIASNEFPIYEDFFLLLLNKYELFAVASELKIPIKPKGLHESEYATPVSIFLVAHYLTFCDLENLILAFIKS